MKYNYQQLQSDYVKSAVKTHFNTDSMYILEGYEITTIYIEDGPLFVIIDGEVTCQSTTLKLNAENLSKIAAVARVIQTAITLTCPEFEKEVQ